MKPIIGVTLLLLVLALAGTGAWVALRQRQEAPAPVVPACDRHDYGLGDESRIIDIATQPSDLCPAFISECLFHDRILQNQLAASGWTLREHRFSSGKDIVPYCDGRLEAMFMGDFPALVAMASHNVGIFAITSHGYDTIIASRVRTPAELKGLRIGYPPGSSARFTLERALAIANLAFSDIISVPLQPNDLEASLREHRVDAVIAWEPTASRIFVNIAGSHPVFRSETFTYIALDLDFCTRQPTLAKALLAALVRATRWGSQNEKNLFSGLHWMREGELAFAGASAIETNGKWVATLRKEGIDGPSFPMLPLDLAAPLGRFHRQFQYLQFMGSLEATQTWNRIVSAINFTELPEIIRNGNKWRIDSFNYAPTKLIKHNKD